MTFGFDPGSVTVDSGVIVTDATPSSPTKPYSGAVPSFTVNVSHVSGVPS